MPLGKCAICTNILFHIHTYMVSVVGICPQAYFTNWWIKVGHQCLESIKEVQWWRGAQRLRPTKSAVKNVSKGKWKSSWYISRHISISPQFHINWQIFSKSHLHMVVPRGGKSNNDLSYTGRRNWQRCCPWPFDRQTDVTNFVLKLLWLLLKLHCIPAC